MKKRRAFPLTPIFFVMQRGDGVGLCATSHDREVERDGLRYDPVPALAPAELILRDDLFSSSMRFSGALDSDGLREEDLAAGRWASASVLFSSGDWSGGDPLELLCKGELGAVRFGDGALEADLVLVPSQAMKQPCPQTSPECRAQLGDGQCRVAMRTRQVRARVTGVDGADILVSLARCERFRFGRLRWLSGQNSGIEHAILDTGRGGLRFVTGWAEHRPSATVSFSSRDATDGCGHVRSGSRTSQTSGANLICPGPTSSPAIRVVDAFSTAKAMVGVKFTPQGRSEVSGVDCIGLVLCAFDIQALRLPRYRLSDGTWDEIEAVLFDHFTPAGTGLGQASDLLICRLPRCFHFGVLGPASIIHADLRAARVVEAPGQTLGAVQRRYRRRKQGEN